MARYLLYGFGVLTAGWGVHETFSVRPDLLELVHFVYVILMAALVVRLRVALDRERALARTDVLTGVPNRRTFMEAADARIRRMGRDGAPCIVLYLDIDGFKAINDHQGHAVGDTVLRAVAQTLAAQVRGCDIVARLGGDEFAVLLEGALAEPVIFRVRAALRALARERGWQVGFSIGAVTFTAPPASAEEMLGRTDAAMYAAKQQGDHIVFRVA